MPNILIADDEKEIVKLLRIYLETDGVTVFEACDGAQVEPLEVAAKVKAQIGQHERNGKHAVRLREARYGAVQAAGHGTGLGLAITKRIIGRHGGQNCSIMIITDSYRIT